MNLKNTTTVKGQAGFSLVELMVVVGIIGLLAAIAVPQFSKFQARARQSEAKTILASIFTGEKAFFAEWNTYTASMSNAGVGYTGSKIRYEGGVSAAGVACPNPAAGAPPEAVVTVFAASNLTAGTATYDAAGGMAAPVTAITAGATCDNTAKTFTGEIYGDPNNVALTPFNTDQWTISHLKAIVNVANGIR
jgi:type IV pilus assembly protein PilA